MPDQDVRISTAEVKVGGASVPAAPAMSPGDVHVWEIPLTVSESDLTHYNELLSPDEKTRAARFHFASDSRKFTIARGALRSILGSYAGLPARDLRFTCSQHGKPSLSDTPGDIRFNVSHSGDWALVAVTRSRDVGVDVEAMREDVETDKLAERFFSTRERAAIRALPSGQRVSAFYRCWTCKEAFLKGQGVGLFRSLDSFDVEVNPHVPARLLSTRPDHEESRHWLLHDIEAAPHYAAAVAAERPVSAITILRSPTSNAG